MALIQPRTVKLLLIALAVTAVMGSAVWFIADWVREQRMTKLADGYVEEMISLLDLTVTPDFHQRVDKVAPSSMTIAFIKSTGRSGPTRAMQPPSLPVCLLMPSGSRLSPSIWNAAHAPI